jgi:hypothetical protein
VDFLVRIRIAGYCYEDLALARRTGWLDRDIATAPETQYSTRVVVQLNFKRDHAIDLPDASVFCFANRLGMTNVDVAIAGAYLL